MPAESRLWRRVLAVLALTLIGAEATCNGEAIVPPIRTHVIFIDLSLSLSDTQTNVLPAVLDALVGGMPAGSRVVAYPISEKVVAAGPLYETTLPQADNATERLRLEAARKQLVPNLLKAVDTMRSTLQSGTTLKHTCISDALRQAAKDASQFRTAARAGLDDLEIIFISDMLEDCRASLLRTPISLEKIDITTEIILARSVPEHVRLVDLQRAHVTILLPPIALAQPRTKRPEEYDLEAFWRAVLDRCNDDPNAFYFGASLPERLKRSNR